MFEALTSSVFSPLPFPVIGVGFMILMCLGALACCVHKGKSSPEQAIMVRGVRNTLSPYFMIAPSLCCNIPYR